MTIIYREDGAWGSGKGSNLTAAELDGNFYDLDGRVDALESYGVIGVGISNIVQDGTQLTVYLTDSSTVGPFTLPQGRGFYVETSERTTNQTLAASDHGALIRINSASARTVTISPNSSVDLDLGHQTKVARMGAGALTILPGSGVTLMHPSVATDGSVAIPSQYQTAVLTQVATDSWLVELSA